MDLAEGRAKVTEHRYQTVARRIAEEICPRVAIGECLPPMPEICRRYKVSEITAKRALRLLADKGVVRRIPKTGTILAQAVTKDITAGLNRRTTLSVLALQNWNFAGAMKELCHRFCSANESIGFDFIEVPQAQYEELIRTRPFDLILVNTWWMRQFMTDGSLKNQFVPVSNLKGLWVDEESFFPQILTWCKNGAGELACWPVNFSTVLNRVAEAARMDSTLDFTLDEFASWLTALRERTPGNCAPFLLNMHQNRWPIVLKSLGAELFSEDGTRCLMDSPQAIEGLEFLTDLIGKRLCMPLLPSDSVASKFGVSSLFAMNKFACCWVTCAGLGKLDFPARLAPLPRGRHPVSQLLIEGLMLGRGSRHAEVIKDFLNFLRVFENQEFLAERSDGFSCRSEFALHYTARKKADFPGFENFVASLQFARPLVAAPRQSAMQMLEERLGAVWLGVEPAAHVCPALTREVNGHLRAITVQ